MPPRPESCRDPGGRQTLWGCVARQIVSCDQAATRSRRPIEIVHIVGSHRDRDVPIGRQPTQGGLPLQFVKGEQIPQVPLAELNPYSRLIEVGFHHTPSDCSPHVGAK